MLLRLRASVGLAALLGGSLLVGCSNTVAQPIGREMPVITQDGGRPAKELPPRPFERIPPGTVIGDGCPDGWSCLVSVAMPRLGAGDVNDAPAAAKTFTNMFWPTILANVKKEGPSFVLDKVAIGYALPVNGRRVVGSSRNPQGLSLGLIGSQVFRENEKFLDESRSPAYTPTMQVFDIPGLFVRGEEHRPMWMRHAVLVNPKTGDMASVVWLLDKDGDESYPLGEDVVQVLPANCREDRVLDVKGEKITFGIPSADAFAQVSIPQGRPAKVTPALQKVAGLKSYTTKTAAELEAALREAIGDKWPK